MAKVSILIPCHNAERWVSRAIQSGLDQTHEDKEVIVVDDGSTDGSIQVIQSFGELIRYETGSNQGGNVARNRLLELASGDWVQYLDADDYLLPDKISTQLESVRPAGLADLVYSPPLIETWENGDVVDRSIGQYDAAASIEIEWIRWRVAQTGTMLWRKESLKAIGGWNEAYHRCQDNELTLRAIQRGARIIHVPRADAVYRLWSNETVCRQNPIQTLTTKSILLEEMVRHLEHVGRFDRAARTAVGQAYFETARTLAQYDLAEAEELVRIQQKKKLLRIAGPAAPWSFRTCYFLSGYLNAEKVAALTRKIRKKFF